MNDAATGQAGPIGGARALPAQAIAGILVVSLVVGAMVFVFGRATAATEYVVGATVSLGRADASTAFNSQKVDDLKGLLISRPVLDRVTAESGVSRQRLRGGLAIGNIKDGRLVDITYTSTDRGRLVAVLESTIETVGVILGEIEIDELTTTVGVLEARIADTTTSIGGLNEQAGVLSLSDEFSRLDGELSDLVSQRAVAIRLGGDNIAELDTRIAAVLTSWNQVARFMEQYRFLDRQRSVLIDDVEQTQVRLGEARVDSGTVSIVGAVAERGTVSGSRSELQAGAIAAGVTAILLSAAALLLPSLRGRSGVGDAEEDSHAPVLDPQLN